MCFQFIIGEVPFLVPLYSPECVEGLFCELRAEGVPRSSARIILSAPPCSSLRPMAPPVIAGTISVVEPRRSDP